MEETKFNVTLPANSADSAAAASVMFNEIAGGISDVDFEYDFDYEFRGYNEDEGWDFSVYVYTDDIEDAYTVMSDKFDNSPYTVYWD